MMKSQILKSVDLTKTQKSKYLEQNIFSLWKTTLWQKICFVAEVTFKRI